MIARRLRAALVGLLCGLLLTGCTAESSPTTASASPSPTAVDFREPGAASNMVAQLVAKAGSDRVLSIEITRSSVEVTVLDPDDAAVAWAYRQGVLAEVPTDQQYVDQATFDVAGFNLADVGALFRAAAGQSGSEQDQSLTIVDYSGGNVTMSVSTIPESRTVFFTPAGALLPILAFDTPGGISAGLADVTQGRSTAYSVSVDSELGAAAEYPGASDTVIRLSRTAKVPVTTNTTARNIDLPLFPVSQVNPQVIWDVIDRLRSSGELSADGAWSVVVDDREDIGHPRMYFSFGTQVVSTDLAGNQLP